MNRTLSIPAVRILGNPPPPEPRAVTRAAINRAWQREVETRRRLAALTSGVCLECEQPVGEAEIWHPACAPERGM